MPPTVMWFRRDLRLADNPALCAAIAEANGAETHAVFVLDPRLLAPAGAARTAFLTGCLEGYPDRIVDHDAERKVALARYAEIR